MERDIDRARWCRYLKKGGIIMFGSIEYRERQMALHRKMRQQAKERQSVLIASGQFSKKDVITTFDDRHLITNKCRTGIY